MRLAERAGNRKPCTSLHAVEAAGTVADAHSLDVRAAVRMTRSRRRVSQPAGGPRSRGPRGVRDRATVLAPAALLGLGAGEAPAGEAVCSNTPGPGQRIECSEPGTQTPAPKPATSLSTPEAVGNDADPYQTSRSSYPACRRLPRSCEILRMSVRGVALPVDCR